MRKSTEHHIEKQVFPPGTSCSSTRCGNEPVFLVRYRTSKGIVERRYCSQHGAQFALKNELPLPLTDADVPKLSISGLSTKGLSRLVKRTNAELFKRQKGEQHTIRFDETGQEEHKPYAARIYETGGRIKRFFFEMTQTRVGHRRLRLHGEYATYTGAIIEMRLGSSTDNGKPEWNRYIISDKGEEILLGPRKDYELEKDLFAYWRQEMSAQALIARSRAKQRNDDDQDGRQAVVV